VAHVSVKQTRKTTHVRGASGAGASGTFYAFLHDPAKGKGSGFRDYWKHDADGKPVRDSDGFPIPVNVDSITAVRTIRNKWLRRGISAVLHRSLSGHPGGPYVPSDVTSNQTRNPFRAFFVAGDAPGKPADARVEWDESDGVSDNKMPTNTGVAGEGRRALINTGATGPGLHRVSYSYPTTSPYREIEFVYFAQANTPAFAAGQVVVSDGSTMTTTPAEVGNLRTIVLDDGINPALTFEFDSDLSLGNWDGDPANNIPIRIGGGDTQAQVRDQTVAVINEILDGVRSGSLLITAAAGAGGDVDLIHDTGGLIGNNVITVANAGLSKTDFVGGSGALELLDDAGTGAEIDNLHIKTLGKSYGILNGAGEADSQIGIRAVTGLTALAQGFSDRIYEHEGAGADPGLRANSLHKYTIAETLGGVGLEGYVVNDTADPSATTDETPVIDRTITVDALDHIEESDDSVFLANGDLDLADEGRTITFVGNANNPGSFYLTQVITKRRAILTPGAGVSAITIDDNGVWTSTTIQDLNLGAHAFDGDVLNEGVLGVMELGQNYRSNNAVGPHILGRVWQAAKGVAGIRIIGGAGVPKDNYPDLFTVQFLDSDAVGGVSANLIPYDDAHWTTIDSPLTVQATSIFDGAEHGFEILFTTPPNPTKCFGIRLKDMQGFDPSVSVEIAELMAFTTRGAINLTAGTNDLLRLATSQTPTSPGVPNGTPGTYRNYEVGTLATTGVIANEDMQQVADEINRAHLEGASVQTILRGFELEALRSELGYLWVRTTVAGNNVQLDLDSDDNTGTGGNKSCNAELGLQLVDATVTQKVGTTQSILKLPEQAMTIIYRANISGDLPIPTP